MNNPDPDTDDLYYTPKEPDSTICEELLSILETQGQMKPWELVSNAEKNQDHDEIRYALKTLLLKGTIRIKANGKCTVNTESEHLVDPQ